MKLRYSERHRAPVPHHWGLCCFYKNDVEDPSHALLVCEGSDELVQLRITFLNSLFDTAPTFKTKTLGLEHDRILLLMLMHTDVVIQLAKYTHDVLSIYNATDIYIVDCSVYKDEGTQDPREQNVSIDILLYICRLCLLISFSFTQCCETVCSFFQKFWELHLSSGPSPFGLLLFLRLLVELGCMRQLGYLGAP